MRFDMDKLAARERYKLITSVVVPRPIAWVTTIDDQGVVNAAPFSFFNAMGADPPLVVLGLSDRTRGLLKDTARNIRTTGQFVVNTVTEALAEQMNATAADFPPGVDELAAVGLSAAPSHLVRPPRVAESPVSMECREVSTTEIGRNRIILGEVLCMHIRDEFIDAERFYVHTAAIRTVGRMQPPGWYTRTDSMFEMERPVYDPDTKRG